MYINRITATTIKIMTYCMLIMLIEWHRLLHTLTYKILKAAFQRAFQKCGTQNSERLKDLPMATQLINNRQEFKLRQTISEHFFLTIFYPISHLKCLTDSRSPSIGLGVNSLTDSHSSILYGRKIKNNGQYFFGSYYSCPPSSSLCRV